MRALTQQELSNLEQMQAQPAGRRAWLGVGGKLYLAFGAIAAATVIAGVLAMVAFEEAQQALVRLSDRSIPVISESLALSRDGTAIVAAAPALAAVRTESDRAAARARLDRLIGQVGERNGKPEAMQADGVGRAAEVVRKIAAAIVSLDQAVGRRLSLAAARERIIVDASTAHTGLLNLLVPMVALPNFELLLEAESLRPYECDGLSGYRQVPLAVCLPEDVAQVQAPGGMREYEVLDVRYE